MKLLDDKNSNFLWKEQGAMTTILAKSISFKKTACPPNKAIRKGNILVWFDARGNLYSCPARKFNK